MPVNKNDVEIPAHLSELYKAMSRTWERSLLTERVTMSKDAIEAFTKAASEWLAK